MGASHPQQGSSIRSKTQPIFPRVTWGQKHRRKAAEVTGKARKFNRYHQVKLVPRKANRIIYQIKCRLKLQGRQGSRKLGRKRCGRSRGPESFFPVGSEAARLGSLSSQLQSILPMAFLHLSTCVPWSPASQTRKTPGSLKRHPVSKMQLEITFWSLFGPQLLAPPSQFLVSTWTL